MTRLFLAPLLVIAILPACSLSGDEESGDTMPVEATTTGQATDGGEAPAPQEPGVAEDPDDTTGPLDLKSISGVRAGDLLALSLTTYERWDDDVVAGPRLAQPGRNRLTVLYDIDLDGRADYTGKIIFAEEALSVVIAGQGQAFEPVPVERPDDATAQFVHPADVFLVVLGQDEVESDVDIRLAFESVVEGAKDRAPDRGWMLVAVAP